MALGKIGRGFRVKTAKSAWAKRRESIAPGIPASPEPGGGPAEDVNAAYRRNLPCLNPNCKSHGRSHPNCRCYGFAEGGEVGNFCSEAREHNPDCEYYASGGDVAPDWDSLPEPQSAAPDWGSLPKIETAGAPSWDELPSKEASSGDGGWTEQLKAGAEGAAQGLLGPIAPMLETGLGISTKEAINKRAEDFPLTHGIAEGATFAASMLYGVGEAGLIAKGAGAAAKASEMGLVGSSLLKAAVETSSFAASDEMTKAFLGQPGSDPEHPVSAALLNVGAAGLMGAATGGVFTLGEGLIGKGMAHVGSEEGVAQVEKLLDKMGNSKDPLGDLGISKKIASTISKTVAWPIAMKTGSGQIGYEAIEAAIQPYVKKFIGKANPYAADAVIKAILTNELSGMPNAVHYALKAGAGAKAATAGIGSIMKAGSGIIAPAILESEREKIREFIDQGGVPEQLQNTMGEQNQGNNFAHGGQVKSEPNGAFSRVFPEQNTILSTAKGRISNYINSLKPQKHQAKAVFDDVPPTKEQSRQYNKAIDFAIRPLSVLDHINRGELTPENLKHFQSLYPEVHRFLAKEMTKQITEAQLKGEKPPYGKRQAMSLFLGADLDSSFSPVAIQTIQGLYANKQSVQQPATQTKKSGSNMSKMSSSYQTDDQAREIRHQNQKA